MDNPGTETLTRAPRMAGLSARIETLVGNDAPLLFVCTMMILLGVWLRVQGLGFPESTTFDEDHFVNGARAYLHGQIDTNDHPPLGKLLIAAAMSLGGDNSFAWRIVPLFFGLANIVLAAAWAQNLFRSTRAAMLAAAFVACDGFLIAYSRTALLDGMITGFILASGLAALRATKTWHLALAAVLGGCATAIKFNGVVTLAPIVLACLVQRQRLPVRAWLMPLLVPVVYVAVFSLGLAIAHRPFGPVGIWEATMTRVDQHLAAHLMWHPDSSRWFTWFLPKRPITLRFLVDHEPWVRAMTTLGNPLLWWSTSAAMLGFAGWLLWLGPKLVVERLRGIMLAEETPPVHPRADTALATQRPFSGPFLVTFIGAFVQAHFRALAWLVLLWGAALAPWIVSTRDSYVYHYLPSYTAGLVLVAGLLDWLYARKPLAALILLLAVAEVAILFAPVWGQLPITRLDWDRRLFLPMWR